MSFPANRTSRALTTSSSTCLPIWKRANSKTRKKHIDAAVVDLAAAKTFLEQATNNKGTYRPTAIKLCDDAKEALGGATPDVAKATEITNHALKEVNMAGHAGSHR